MTRVVATLTVAGLAMLAAACGGPKGGHVAQLGSTTTSSYAPAAPAQASRWLAYSGCMRSHGVSRYPDPDRSGKPPKKSLQQLGVGSSQIQAAQSACRHLLPNGGLPPSQARLQQVKAQGLRFAQCVRAHGVPAFPDPDSIGRIPDPASVGIDQGSPEFRAANQGCAKDRPPYVPSNSAYNAWARTHPNG